MKRVVPFALLVVATLSCSTVAAGPDDSAAEAHKKLGDAYATATPVDKLVLISIAFKDKLISNTEAAAALAVVVTMFLSGSASAAINGSTARWSLICPSASAAARRTLGHGRSRIRIKCGTARRSRIIPRL